MAIITLTSDLGTRDYYVSAVKGALYKEKDSLNLVDITHNISPFNHLEAAYILQQAYSHFPEGTVHIISVDSEPISTQRGDIEHVVVEKNGHFFIGTDNGIFSLMFPGGVDSVYNLENLEQSVGQSTFPMLNIFSKAAVFLINGGVPSVLGRAKNGVFISKTYPVQSNENGLTGTIMYIDSFGNVVTNIHRSVFNKVGNGRKFECLIRNTNYGINRICQKYSDVEKGNALAIFTSNDYLQIAINHGANGAGGGAASLFGLQLFSQIHIEFQKAATSLSDF